MVAPLPLSRHHTNKQRRRSKQPCPTCPPPSATAPSPSSASQSPAPTLGPSLPNPDTPPNLSSDLASPFTTKIKKAPILRSSTASEMPHRAEVAPKGCVTVRVGADGEDQRRFAVPLGHLKHPLFSALLEEAEREYGFRQQGAIAIPCRVDRFVHVENLIDRDLGDHHLHLVDLDANCGATVVGTGGGHGNHGGHIHLPRFVGCFRA